VRAAEEADERVWDELQFRKYGKGVSGKGISGKGLGNGQNGGGKNGEENGSTGGEGNGSKAVGNGSREEKGERGWIRHVQARVIPSSSISLATFESCSTTSKVILSPATA